jgi:uncharacterized protein YecE (DUF72 family)
MDYAPVMMACEYRIGCSGYYYQDWKGIWYPHELKSSQWFAYYARHFDTLEINSSFYHFPTKSTVRRWYRQAPEGFIYSVKAPRLITHFKRFKDCEPQLTDFYQVLRDELAEKLGCILFQLPPSIRFSDETLKKILGVLQPGFHNVLEFRHPGWWNEAVYRALRDADVGFCCVSAPDLPKAIVTTSNNLYLRFHGNPWYRQNYGERELESWAERIRNAIAKRKWIYFNNDSQAFAPDNAVKLRMLLTKEG